MTEKDLLKTEKWLSKAEIDKNLENVEYIVMAAPTMEDDASTPIHFTIYLNTQDALPDDIAEQVFNKFAHEYEITKVTKMFNGLGKVAFSLNDRDTAMPVYIMDQQFEGELDSTQMHLFDFEGNAKGFKECKTQGKTGWTYSYVS